MEEASVMMVGLNSERIMQGLAALNIKKEVQKETLEKSMTILCQMSVKK